MAVDSKVEEEGSEVKVSEPCPARDPALLYRLSTPQAFRVSLQPDPMINFDSWASRGLIIVTADSDHGEIVLGHASISGSADSHRADVEVLSDKWTSVVGSPDSPCAAYVGPYKIIRAA